MRSKTKNVNEYIYFAAVLCVYNILNPFCTSDHTCCSSSGKEMTNQSSLAVRFLRNELEKVLSVVQKWLWMTGFLLIFQFDCFGIALFWWSFNSVWWQSHPGNSCSILYSSKFHWLIVLESKTLKPPPSDGHLIDCVITTRCRNWGRPNITRAIIRRQQCRILFTKYHSGNVLVVLW